jgi:hypothetical protein
MADETARGRSILKRQEACAKADSSEPASWHVEKAKESNSHILVFGLGKRDTALAGIR